jgi:Fuc2NAc and GlcNAc transferase
VKFYYLLSFSLGALGALSVAHFGNTLGLLDRPNERSSHSKPIPKGGGIGLLAAFLFSSSIAGISYWFWIPAASISLLGLFTDRFEISPKFRLTTQFIAALILLVPILFSNSFPHFYSQHVPPNAPSISLGFSILLLILLSIFIVGTANFYNFMDGINGIAGITGFVGFGLIAFYASHFESHASLVTLAICISLACMGFLPFNMPKARVFMGDVGSILIGFVFAGMVVYLSKSFLDFICLVSLLLPFYADELTTMIVRIMDGERLSQPHRRHLYQLLANEYEVTHWKVSVGYGFTQLLIGISILLIKDIGNMAVISALVFYFSGFSMLSFFLRKKIESRS